MIAPCGIDCEKCDIRLLPTNSSAANRVLVWFKNMGWIKSDDGVQVVMEKKMYCHGCLGDREIHWSPDCPILNCCHDQRGLEYCYQCPDFVCEKLSSWSKESKMHTKALERLIERNESQ